MSRSVRRSSAGDRLIFVVPAIHGAASCAAALRHKSAWLPKAAAYLAKHTDPRAEYLRSGALHLPTGSIFPACSKEYTLERPAYSDQLRMQHFATLPLPPASVLMPAASGFTNCTAALWASALLRHHRPNTAPSSAFRRQRNKRKPGTPPAAYVCASNKRREALAFCSAIQAFHSSAG